MATTTRAYTPHTHTWQRFHEYAAPLLSSSGAGSAADAALVASAAQNNPYSRQYSHVYSARLAMLRGRCVEKAEKCWKDDTSVNNKGGIASCCVVDTIIEVKEGVWSILVGTVVKEVDAKRRPEVEIKYNHAADAQSFLFPNKDADHKVEQEPLTSFLFDSERGDVLHLEDESGRLELLPEEASETAIATNGSKTNSNALDPNKVATGVVAAVVGKICASKGIMRVHSIHFAGPPPTAKDTPNSELLLRGPTSNGDKTPNDNEPILLIVSGLNCGSDAPSDNNANNEASLALRREMLLEYLTDPTLSNGSSVCRVIVAGGGVSPIPTSTDDESNNDKSTTATKKNYDAVAKFKHSKNNTESHVAFALRELDFYLSELLAGGIPVDYIPGMHDPTNANWPQRPLHSCLLPLSCGFVDLFGSSTNPYEGVFGGDGSEKSGGLRVLGSDGLNIADLRRFLTAIGDGKEDVGKGGYKEDGVSAASCIDALNATLNYGHMAPTGPDSLPTFPSSELDPFVLKSRPSVYFVGNCDKFETRLVDINGNAIAGDKDGHNVTRLICVPSFALTGEVVLVKLKSLECQIVS